MNAPPSTAPNPPASTAPQTRLPLRGWALELARRWNGGTYSLFVLHGNIYDLFPVQDNGDLHYVPLKTFLVRRFFPERACLLFYDISDGLTFGSSEMQKRFFDWLGVYDSVENTNFHAAGPPRDFVRLAPLLRRFFERVAEEQEKWRGHNAGDRFSGEAHTRPARRPARASRSASTWLPSSNGPPRRRWPSWTSGSSCWRSRPTS